MEGEEPKKEEEEEGTVTATVDVGGDAAANGEAGKKEEPKPTAEGVCVCVSHCV